MAKSSRKAAKKPVRKVMKKPVKKATKKVVKKTSMPEQSKKASKKQRGKTNGITLRHLLTTLDDITRSEQRLAKARAAKKTMAA